MENVYVCGGASRAIYNSVGSLVNVNFTSAHQSQMSPPGLNKGAELAASVRCLADDKAHWHRPAASHQT